MLQQIKILVFLLLISMSGISQTASLKNGFVAATDSGLWYLQDGFHEWVSLDISGNAFYYSDSMAAVSFNGSHLTVNAKGDNDSGYQTYLVYGDKINSQYGGSGIGDFNTKNLKSKSKFNNFRIWYQYTPLYSQSYIVYHKGFYDFSGEEVFSSELATSISGDNDTTYCVVGENNTMKKIQIHNDGTNTLNVVSGLHSRSTDRHVIIYNEDDDEFIIVSDSGIVYSYDKTTLTTLDTLNASESTPGYSFTEVSNLAYNKGQIMTLTTGDNSYPNYKFITTHNLDALSSHVYSLTYTTDSVEIAKNKNDFAIVFYDAAYSYLVYVDDSGSDSFKVLTGFPDGKTIFDLDYINN